MARNFKELREKMEPVRRARVEKRVQEALKAMPLDELRQARELTQTQLAQVLQVSQGAVSKVERRADMYISTLRSYVRAIGGDLQIRAVFPEGEVLIDQFEDLNPNSTRRSARDLRADDGVGLKTG
jgi:transcriptional regulator with XRE-family HTH domain